MSMSNNIQMYLLYLYLQILLKLSLPSCILTISSTQHAIQVLETLLDANSAILESILLLLIQHHASKKDTYRAELGKIYMAQKERNQAMELFLECNMASLSKASLESYCTCSLLVDQPSVALAVLKHMYACFPEDDSVIKQLVEVHVRLGDPHTAVAFLEPYTQRGLAQKGVQDLGVSLQIRQLASLLESVGEKQRAVVYYEMIYSRDCALGLSSDVL